MARSATGPGGRASGSARARMALARERPRACQDSRVRCQSICGGFVTEGARRRETAPPNFSAPPNFDQDGQNDSTLVKIKTKTSKNLSGRLVARSWGPLSPLGAEASRFAAFRTRVPLGNKALPRALHRECVSGRGSSPHVSWGRRGDGQPAPSRCPRVGDGDAAGWGDLSRRCIAGSGAYGPVCGRYCDAPLCSRKRHDDRQVP